MPNAIVIQNVHKTYRQLEALRGITLDIPQGSFFGLLGPNGAGKSTLINIIAGLVRANQGQITVLGHDVVKDWRLARFALGIVPQELVYDAFFNVREMLKLQAGYFGLGKENEPWIDELLETLSLTSKANESFLRLSGGMKRRLLIALALVHKPKVVVLDEPTAGVDVELRQALWQFAKKLHQAGHTILLTTHYLEEAEALCEKIAILNHGEMIALDQTKNLLARHPYRWLYLDLKENYHNFPFILKDKIIHQKPQQLVLRLHRDKDSIVGILEELRNANIEVIDLHMNEPSLEEVFIHLINQEVSS
jgi:ABC-2 type transport system ATP-binding protein